VGRLGSSQRLAQAGMRQHEVVLDVEQRQWVPHAVLTLAQRGDPAADRGHALADIETHSLHKGRVDLPATHC
jgi:hypothetical protein